MEEVLLGERSQAVFWKTRRSLPSKGSKRISQAKEYGFVGEWTVEFRNREKTY